MNLSMHQNLEQQQKLILTTKMQQSLKILQMSLVDLQTEISKELEENPLLDTTEEEPAMEDNRSFDEVDSYELGKLIMNKAEESYDYGAYVSEESSDIDPFNFVVEKSTLKDYLEEQLLDLHEDDNVIDICKYIIDNLDDRGYLDYTLEEIARDLNVSLQQVGHALELVQGFQPDGIAARDLKECLIIQLRKKKITDDNIYKLIEGAMELISANKIKEIAKKYNLDINKVKEYCNIIKSLEPKPSRGFYTGEYERYAIPEASIKKIGNEFYILMNSSVLPNLIINQHYKDMINNQEDKEAVTYLKDRLSSAVNLIKSIESRQSTVYNVLAQIVEIQRKYFEAGDKYLKPMTIGEIAEKLDIHESTVSRAIKDKYIETPFGNVKIKDLFTTGIESSSANESISSQIIKREIKELIDNEDKSKPISDQDICNILNSKQIEISRRTVAKYREEMGIASSSKRKVY